MPIPDEMWLISFYVNQLGVVRSKGKSYLKDILRLYLLTGCNGDYSALIKMTATARGVRHTTVSNGITHFLTLSWAAGFSDAWEHYTGWRDPVPPWPTVAVRLVCEGYPSFCAALQKRLEEQKEIPATYYLNWRGEDENAGQRGK